MILRRQRIWRKVAAHAFAITLLPLTFFVVLFIWHEMDRYHGRHEVAEFIVRHLEGVQHRLTDPRVYSFSLAPDPNDPSTLRIEFDVEDKATYHMLEDDIADSVKLRFIPKWNTTLRSTEELGNDFGAMGAGIGEAMEGLMRCGVAAIVSVCIFFIALTFIRIVHAPEEQSDQGEQ